MNKKVLFVYTVISTFLMLCIAASPAMLQNQKAVGLWEGKMSLGQSSLRIVIKIQSVNDTLTWSMSSPDQGGNDIPGSTVTTKNDSVILEIPSIQGIFNGILCYNGDSLCGMWNQGPASVPLNLRRVEKLQEVLHPQEPKPPFPYKQEEVSFENKKDSVRLGGTLTIPQGKGPFPAVILITGSGSQSRNEDIFGHKPFLVISDYLTRRGIVVLRYDDRGVDSSTGNINNSTIEDFAEDVLCGVTFLKQRKEINPKKIGLIGHSEGGTVAPLAASQSRDVAFIVMMAGPSITGEEVVQTQSEALLRNQGAPEEVIRMYLHVNEMYFALLRENLDSASFVSKRSEAISGYVAQLPDSTKKYADPNQMEQQMNPNMPKWFRHFLTYDPRIALRKVRCPVLALNGEKDLQVLPKINLSNIEKALKEGGNKKQTVKEFKGLNHIFQHAETGSVYEYARIEETISPEVLATIGDWIQQTVK